MNDCPSSFKMGSLCTDSQLASSPLQQPTRAHYQPSGQRSLRHAGGMFRHRKFQPLGGEMSISGRLSNILNEASMSKY